MKKGLFFFVLSLICTMTFAQNAKPQWTKVTSDRPETFKTQLLSSSENSIKVNVQVPGFYTTTVTTPRGEASIISMPKSVSTANAGEPNLPMTGIPVMIGDKARMNTRIVDAQYMDFQGIEVAPSKGDFSRQIDPATVPYTYGECYSQDAFFPASNLDLYEPYIIRDFRGQNMAVYPFAYNPVTRTLRVYYNMTVEMYKVDNNGKNVIESRKSNEVKMSPDFKSVYQHHFINFEAGMAKYTPLDEEGDLLIICYDNFISSMTDFVNWKKTRGINTTIVGTSTVASSLTYSNLQTYIRNQYNANNNLTHVLLVGDVAQIPGYTYTGATGYEGKGDNPYGQIIGNDVYNDLFIGRFSASNTTQVQTQVQRTITYERDLTTSDTWCQNGLGVSTTAGSGGHYNEDDYQHVENLRTDLMNYGYSTVYQDYKDVSGFPSSTTTTISNHINSGVGVINYCNHGEQTGWQSHYYMSSHVNALTNENKLPFIFSVACLNGQYDYSSDCFAEAWMRATNNGTPTGAIGTMMSYISQPWIPPMWAQDEFVDILVESYSNNIKRTWGGASMNGLFSIFDNYSTTNASALGTYQAWICYGDPTLMLRTKTPQAITVNHESVLPVGVPTFTVNVSNAEGAVATLTDANHNILGKATVSNGIAEISITGAPVPGDELTLCVFGYNKVTYLGTVTVITLDGPYIAIDSYTPNLVLVEEDANLSITFKNLGSSATTGNTNITLSCENDYVTLLNETGSFGALDADATTTVNGFRFRFNSGIALGTGVLFHYQAVNGNDIWEGDFVITPNQIFNVTVAANNANYGTVSGEGNYNYGESCTVNAIPADGYLFSSWTLNGNVVSSDAEYTFNVTSDMNLVATFTIGVMIGNGEETNTFLPSYNYYNNSLSEQIYTADEVGGAGFITSIAFYNGGAEKTLDYNFYLKSTTKSSFSSKTDWIAVSDGDLVFSGQVTMTANDWTTITFSNPFVYDGTSNIVLVVDKSTSWTGTPHMACRVFNTTSSQAIYAYDDNIDFNPMSPASNTANNNAILNVKNQIILTKEAFGDCMRPSNLTVTEIGPDFVKLSWSEHGTSEQWVVVCGDRTVEANTNEDFVLDGLDPETEYTITVSPVCDENLYSTPITVTTLVGCPIPQNVEVINITPTNATVTWAGYDDSYNVQLGVPSFLIIENFDNEIPANWDNSSSYPWTIVDGHLQSGNAGVGNSTSSISVTVTYPAEGTISFDFWSRGEGSDSNNWDKSRFYIDDQKMIDYGNHTDWESYSTSVTSGTHTFKWEYKKDNSVNPSGDCFMVDNLEMRSGETYWNTPIAVDVTEYSFDGLTPATTYCVKIQGLCNGNETDWSEIIIFNTEEGQVFTKTIEAYTENSGYYLIASPIGDVLASEVTNLVDGTYDLYWFDQTGDNEGKEWFNYESNAFRSLETGKGYLYANESTVTLSFTGTPISNNGAVEVEVDYDANSDFAGLNLVGNPFGEEAYLVNANGMGLAYHRLNPETNLFETVDNNTAIDVIEGIFYEAGENDDVVYFSTTAPNTSKSNLNIVVSQGRGMIDNAIIRFGEGNTLKKIALFGNNTKVYVPQNGMEYAVVNATEFGEMPINFKAETSGTYTMSFNSNNVEFSYLHLIDNLTGNDVDLVENPSYTFDANTSDYSSRFKLVFATGNANNGSDFAFVSNGNIIVNGEGLLQMFDVTGRMVYTAEVNSAFRIPNSAFTPGVYVLKLNDKTQKIVVK